MAVEFVNKENFQKEQTELVKMILDNRFFKPWKEYNKYNKDENYFRSLNPEGRLELFATAACNQKCDYCYLVKYKDLYPEEFDKKEIILQNLRILVNWLIEENFYIPEIEFFTGEVWHSQFGLDMLDIVLEGIKNGLQTDMIIIPSNCSFILDSVQTQKIQHYINLYQKQNIRLCFSISVDGKIVDNYRPLNNKTVKNDRYYEDLFLFAAHNNYYFHPMVAACNVSQWIENYQWWEEMCLKYERPIENLMMLEVRNDGWSQENINDYIHFLEYLITKKRNQYNSDFEFLDDIFNFNDNNIDMGYIPWALTFADTFHGCTAATSLTVRLGDMAICPCHRTAYNKFLYGHFIVEDNKITDIKGNNPEMASRILLANSQLCDIGCDACPYRKLCLKGCYGSQYETNKDPFIPIENICNLMKEKYSFIVNVYISYGALEYLKTITPYNMHYGQAQEYLSILEELQNVGKN